MKGKGELMKRRNLFSWFLATFFVPKVKAEIHPAIKPDPYWPGKNQKTITIYSTEFPAHIIATAKTGPTTREMICEIVAANVHRAVDKLLEEGPPEYLLDD